MLHLTLGSSWRTVPDPILARFMFSTEAWPLNSNAGGATSPAPSGRRRCWTLLRRRSLRFISTTFGLAQTASLPSATRCRPWDTLSSAVPRLARRGRFVSRSRLPRLPVKNTAASPAVRSMIAASLGPYGAALHDGAEFHGRYSIRFDDLVAFHTERLAVVADTNADLVALETVPSLEEAQAILSRWLGISRNLEHGFRSPAKTARMWLMENVWRSALRSSNRCPNRSWRWESTARQPGLLPPLLPRQRGQQPSQSLSIPIQANVGCASRSWHGNSERGGVRGALAATWYHAGAHAVGGCCRTTPAHIRAVRETLDKKWRQQAVASSYRRSGPPTHATIKLQRHESRICRGPSTGHRYAPSFWPSTASLPRSIPASWLRLAALHA